MISMDKKYRTSDGQKVRILCNDGPDEEFPVIGIVEEKVLLKWDRFGETIHHSANLIEVKPKKVCYVNYYSGINQPGHEAHLSREEADYKRADGRTHILIIEQEEGCDPVVRVEKV